MPTKNQNEFSKLQIFKEEFLTVLEFFGTLTTTYMFAKCSEVIGNPNMPN